MKFKAGDRVRYIGGDREDLTYGKEYVVDVDGDKAIVNDDVGDRRYLYHKHVELIENSTQKTPKWQVGQKVRWIGELHLEGGRKNCINLSIGQIVTLTTVWRGSVEFQDSAGIPRVRPINEIEQIEPQSCEPSELGSHKPGAYCSCDSPTLEDKSYGFGGTLTMYKFCIVCRKESR